MCKTHTKLLLFTHTCEFNIVRWQTINSKHRNISLNCHKEKLNCMQQYKKNTFLKHNIPQYNLGTYYTCASPFFNAHIRRSKYIQNKMKHYQSRWAWAFSTCPSNLVWQWTIWKWVNLTQVLRWPTEQHDKIYDRACGKAIKGHYNVLVVSKYGSPTIKQVVTVWPFNFLQTIFVYIFIHIENLNSTANVLKLSSSH